MIDHDNQNILTDLRLWFVVLFSIALLTFLILSYPA